MLSRRDAADLAWLFLDAEDEIADLGSSWSDMLAVHVPRAPQLMLVDGLWYDADLAFSGRPYVPKPSRARGSTFLDPHSAALVRARPIVAALQRIGPEAYEVLRLCIREKLLVCKIHGAEHLARPVPGCRVPFGIDGASARRDRPMDGCLGVSMTPLRGAGAAAHLTDAARAAYAKDRLRVRVRLTASAWTDRLGGMVCAGSATPGQLELVKQIRREDLALLGGEHGAGTAYHRERAGRAAA